VIEQLTALPRTYTRESMNAAVALNNRIRLEGGGNVLAAAQAAGVRRYLRQSVAFYAIPGPGLADEETPLAFNASPAVAADARHGTFLITRPAIPSGVSRIRRDAAHAIHFSWRCLR